MATKIFVGNYKGGVGKTTSIYQIALHLVEEHKKVLLIDLDPQCSLSEICLTRVNRSLDELEPNECLNYVYDLWLQQKKYPAIQFSFQISTLIKTTDNKVDFIPSNIFYPTGGLDEKEMNLSNSLEDLVIMQQFLQTTRLVDMYDFILFDCPPSNNVITQGSFLCSDYYLIPTIIQTMSVRGVAHYIKTVESIYKKHCTNNPEATLAKALFGAQPKLLGIVETLKKVTVKNHDVHSDLKAALTTANIETVLSKHIEGKYVFSTIIHNSETIARETAKGNKSGDYGVLTNEILSCIEVDQMK
ncbi:ParA family protein [Alkalihalobacterium elongatum]|uniref:ParA family protein n=1 Tax=Alkalihalobacterium elongatum TaxID=2675466 RepID=UPI001C1FC75B|nr:AAA family ATPase [Alkalihalobacterium elongatum]